MTMDPEKAHSTEIAGQPEIGHRRLHVTASLAMGETGSLLQHLPIHCDIDCRL